MAGWEQCVIIGNVGRDPEMRFMPSGSGICSFSVAVTTKWTDRNTNERKERVNWYNVSCFNKLADIAKQYVKKGMPIMIVGTVSARAYTGNDGQPRASLDLRADNFQMLGSGGDGSSGGGASSSGGGNYDDYAPPPQDMDDIPF